MIRLRASTFALRATADKPRYGETGSRRCGASLAVSVCAMAIATIAAGQSDVSWPVRFTDVAEKAGLTHPSIYGGIDRKRFILETNGCGTGDLL